MRKLSYIVFLLSTFMVNVVYSLKNELPKPKSKTEFKKTNFQVGGGLAGSVLYLSRNVKEDNDALGYFVTSNYSISNLLRVSAQYIYYKPINIEPTWYTIKANTLEANLELIARFKNNKTFLYPFVGFSYNTFKGYFTGQNDYLNLKEHYKSNTTVSSQWLGVNIGTGLEHNIGPVVLFFDYRMRLGQMESFGSFNIMDVCYGGGIRLKVYTVKTSVKNIFHNFRNRYKVS